MIVIEGLGRVAPQPLAVQMRTSEVRCLMQEATRRSEHRRYASGTSSWKRGMTGSVSIGGMGTLTPAASPIFIGLMGERATGIKLGCAIDISLLPGGDAGVDLVCGGIALQVKTRRKPTVNMVKRVAKQRILPLLDGVYVFCRYRPDLDPLRVDILGWCSRHALQTRGLLRKAFSGEHFNLTLEDCFLESIREFRKGRE